MGELARLRGWGTALTLSGPIVALAGGATPEPAIVVIGGALTFLWGIALRMLGTRRTTIAEVRDVLMLLGEGNEIGAARIVASLRGVGAPAHIAWLDGHGAFQRGDLVEALRLIDVAFDCTHLLPDAERHRLVVELCSMRALARAPDVNAPIAIEVASLPRGDATPFARGVLARALRAHREQGVTELDSALRELATLERWLPPVEAALLDELRWRAQAGGPYRTRDREAQPPRWVVDHLDGRTAAASNVARVTGRESHLGNWVGPTAAAFALGGLLVLALVLFEATLSPLLALAFSLSMAAGAMVTLPRVAQKNQAEAGVFTRGRQASLRPLESPDALGTQELVARAFEDEARGDLARAFAAADRAIYQLDRGKQDEGTSIARVMELRACLLASLGNPDEARSELALREKRFPREETAAPRARVRLRIALAARNHRAALSALDELEPSSITDRERALRGRLVFNQPETDLPLGHEAWIAAIAPGIRVAEPWPEDEAEAPARMRR